MKLIYSLISVLLLFASCEKQVDVHTTTEQSAMEVTLVVNPSISSSSEGSITTKTDASTTEIKTTGDSFRMGLFKDQDGETAYPNDSYSNIYAYYSSGWTYGFGATDANTTSLSLSLDSDVNELYVAGLCYSSGYSPSRYYNYTSATDITRVAVATSTFTYSTSTSLTDTYYSAQGTIDVSDSNNTETDSNTEDGNVSEERSYSIDLMFKPVFAKFVFNLKLENEHESSSSVTLTGVYIQNSSGFITTGWLNCANGVVTTVGTNTQVTLFSSSLSLSTSDKTLYGFMLPSNEFSTSNSTSLRFTFNSASSSYDNYITLTNAELPKIEAGKVYTFNITLDNYGRFSNVNIDTNWYSESGDIGSSI